MSILEPIILGVIQGVTEFFPISSSGHLLIGMNLFKINEFSLLIEVALHIGTLIAILFYWKDDYYSEFIKLKKGSYDTLFCIIIATIPAGVVGLFLKEEIESAIAESLEKTDFILGEKVSEFEDILSKYTSTLEPTFKSWNSLEILNSSIGIMPSDFAFKSTKTYFFPISLIVALMILPSFKSLFFRSSFNSASNSLAPGFLDTSDLISILI